MHIYSLVKVLDGVVFVLWKWTWATESDEENSNSNDRSSVIVVSETPYESSEESEPELDESLGTVTISSKPIVTHTVTFKSIGCTKDDCYQ